MAQARDAYENPPDENGESLETGYRRRLKKDVMIYREHGRLWVHSHDLIRADMTSDPADFTQVELPDGTIIEFQGKDDTNRRWWVEIVAGPPEPEKRAAEDKPITGWPKFGSGA